MASRAQKRRDALAKRAAYLAELKDEGLKAQELDKAEQNLRAAKLQEFADDINFKHHEILARAGLR